VFNSPDTRPGAKIIVTVLVSMFIRFVVGGEGEHHRSLTGIITEARIRRDNGDLDEHQSARLEEVYRWLNEHLPVPPFNQLPSDAVGCCGLRTAAKSCTRTTVRSWLKGRISFPFV